MGKNKNRNRRKGKILSSTSDGNPCNTLPETENSAGFREDMQNEWDDFFNETSKTNTFKKPDSQKPSLVSAKDKAKLKIDPTAVNETKSSFNKACTQGVSSSSREDVNKSNDLNIRNTENNKVPLVGCSPGSSYVVPAVGKARSREKDQPCPNPNKFITPNGILNDYNLYNGKIENKEWNSVGYSQDPSNKTQLSSNQCPRNAKNNFSCKSTKDISNEVNSGKNVQGNAFNKNMRIKKFSNDSSLGCLDTSISNGIRPNTNILMNQSKNSLNTQIVSKESSESLYKSIKNCEAKSDNFHHSYISWKTERQETIKKLKKLAGDVHNDQRLFNQTNAFFKELNVCSREIKSAKISTPVDFLSSLATLVTDAASGVTCVAQAFNVDAYMDTFAKIMEHDKEITIPLYAVRSLCLKQYQNVEEVLRKYHSDTFGGTVANISISLEELWLDIKGVQGADKTSNVVDCLDQYFRISVNNDTLGKVCSSIQNYTEKNPAALKACASAGKVCYDIYDFWNGNYKGTPSNILSHVANKELLMNEKIELNELRTVSDNGYETQARLESDIYDAIQGLQGEMEQIDNNFEEICYPFKEKFYV